MRGFFYGQTEFNLLNNTIHLEDYISYAQKYNYNFLTITDSNLYGHYKFYKACKKNGIKPIVGLECLITSMDNFNDKFIIYALNNTGYKNLLKISTIEKTKKELTLEDLSLYQEGLAFIVVFNDSIIERLYSSSNETEMNNKLIEYKNRFVNFYLGIGVQNYKEEAKNLSIYNYAKELDIVSLPIHQTKYLEKEDYIVYEALRKIEGHEVIITKFEDYSFPKNIDMEFQSIPELLLNATVFVENVNLDLYNDKITLPRYPNNKGVSSSEYLKALCYKGLEKRLLNKMVNTNLYMKRLEYELLVINKMGFDDYFLIVWDFIKYAKQNEILVGPGRGSAAGSLVAYTLGITTIDPIAHDLLFERFLNPERLTMPDIDTDFPDDKRDDVIKHVKELYGKDHVCNISAYGTFLVKSSIRDLGRVLKIDSKRLDEIIQIVLNTLDYEKLLLDFKEREEIYNLLYIAKKLENLPRHISTHAAGIILSDQSLTEIIPLQNGINDLFQSQLEASDLEEIGLLKMDFLGIRNLTMVDDMLKYIPVLDHKTINDIPLNDQKTFQLLRNADTLGIFQLESNGIKRVLKKLGPTCFEDLVAVLALYRPGPMDNIDEFIARKNGKKFEYIHKSLIPILNNTYGIIVYQEQIMKIAQVFAGYSLGQADLLRRAVSKKDEQKLLEERDNFVRSSIKNRYDEKTANDIYDYIVKFANYGFNRSHSVAYAMLSYQMAYIKANYFDIFIANILNNAIGSKTTLSEYINYAKMNKIKIINPNINISTNKFIPTKNGLIMPLQTVFGIGEVVVRDIISNRKESEFNSISDLRKRVSSLTSKMLEALIYSCAFDSFKVTKKSMINSIEHEADALFTIDKYMDDLIVDKTEFDYIKLQEEERKYLGINIKYNPFNFIRNLYEKYNAQPFVNIKENTFINTIGMFEKMKQFKTKNNEQLLKGILFDEFSNIEFVIFPTDLQKIKEEIKENTMYYINGKISLNQDKKQIIIHNIKMVN